MTQADFNIANQTFPNTRTELNTSLQALATNSAGNSAPSDTYPNQWWFDSDGNILYMRNKDNDAWVSILTIGATSDLQTITTDLIAEVTSGAGVTIDGLTIKDGGIKGTGAQSLVVGSTDGTSARLVLDATNGDASGGDFPVITADGTSLNITANNSGGNAFITFQCNSGEDVRIGPNGKVGIGESVPLGRLHVRTADSSSGAHANADEFVIEGSAYSGMTIASGTTSHGTIAFADSGDSLIGRIIYNHSTNAMSFGTAGVGTQWSINSDGNLLPGNSTGQGIHLGATSAGAANLLDDYEEGTFTPSYTSESGSFSNFNYDTARNGKYTKTGNLVHVSGFIRTDGVTVGSASSYLYLDGLPFAQLNTTAGTSTGLNARSGDGDFSSKIPLTLEIVNNASKSFIGYRDTAKSNQTLMTVADMDTGSHTNKNALYFSITYRTA